MRKIYIILILMITSCSFIMNKKAGLRLQNMSDEWQMVKSASNAVIMENKALLAHINLTNIIYKDSLRKPECEARLKYQMNIVYPIYITFMPKKDNTDIKNYLFNPSKVSLLKNGKTLQCKAIDVFNMNAEVPDKYYNYTPEMQKDGFVTLAFNSPLLCGQLENAELLIDGFAVAKGDNPKPIPLAPIKLRFHFDHPQSIPLYGE